MTRQRGELVAGLNGRRSEDSGRWVMCGSNDERESNKGNCVLMRLRELIAERTKS